MTTKIQVELSYDDLNWLVAACDVAAILADENKGIDRENNFRRLERLLVKKMNLLEEVIEMNEDGS